MSNVAIAQDPALITFAMPGPSQSPPGEFMQTWVAGFNVDALRNGATFVNLNLPNAPAQQVTVELFEPRAGYRFDDINGDGDQEPVPDPNVTTDQISWYWYGKSADWTVALTYEKGKLAGRISSLGMRYAVDPRPNGITELGWVNSAYWKTHESDTLEGAGTATGQAQEIKSLIAPSQQSKVLGNEPLGCEIPTDTWDSGCPGPVPSGHHVIDVLVLYTPRNLVEYGSHAGVRAKMQSAIDDANISRRNSGVTTVSFWLKGVELITTTNDPVNYQETSIGASLTAFGGWEIQAACPYIVFPGNSYVTGRRNANEADIVALARFPTNADGTCGASYVQNVVEIQHVRNPGPLFKKFAYLVFNPGCSVDRLNFAHEIGHLLGLEHDARNSTFADGQSIGQTSCPWSYGHRRAGSNLSDPLRFRTVMSYWHQGNSTVTGPNGCNSSEHCPLIDAFSTPTLQWNGSVVGTFSGMPDIGVPYPAATGLRAAKNSDTLARIGPIVEGFHTRVDVIFADTFQ